MKAGDAKLPPPPGDNPLGWDLAALEAWARSLGEPRYRARQAASWLFGRGETRPESMTDLPPRLRESLARDFPPRLPAVEAGRESDDGTRKLLLSLEDGEKVEMVLIPEGRRTTLCLSTQVGCPVGCLFCSTGRGGLVRNLEAAEIVGQVILARREPGEGRRLTNLVVMGMGEPLLNWPSVSAALRIVTSPWGLGIPQRHLTLSTSGVVPRLDQVRREFPSLNLAVSLNAPEGALRLRLMPGTAPWPLPALMASLEALPGRSRHPVTLEYVLLGGVNDAPLHARALARLIRGKGYAVNLIAWNPVPGAGLRAPSPESVERFAAALKAEGVEARMRKSRGSDIEAACGQLRAGRTLRGARAR